MEKKKKVKVKWRNWNAVSAHFRKAGKHTDLKKERNKKLCRKKITQDGPKQS